MKQIPMHWIGAGISAALIFIIDRITKWYAIQYCVQPVNVLPFFSCVLTYNTGVSWGLFADAHHYLIITIIMSMVFFMCGYMMRHAQNALLVYATSSIITGALANMIDRLWYGAVVDFIMISWRNWHFPVFNIADCAIVIGVLVLLGVRE